jgi:hypothetical protein
LVVCWNGKCFDAARSNEATGENAVATFAFRMMFNMNALRRMSMKRESPVREHPGAFNQSRETRMK